MRGTVGHCVRVVGVVAEVKTVEKELNSITESRVKFTLRLRFD